jgi:hypothetical protein
VDQWNPGHFAPNPVRPGSDKNKVPMNKSYNIQNTNICNGIFHISFFKALLMNEGEATRGEQDSGRSIDQ